MTTVSARPDNLAAYRSTLEVVDRDLRSTAGSLLQTLQAYRARCPEFGADHTELARTLREHATAMEQLDGWVGRVGEAFRRADRAPGPVPVGVVLTTEDSVKVAEPLDELLEKYQVAPDPDGMTEWSPKWVGWLPGMPSMEVTAGEAKMLDDLQDHQGLVGIQDAYDIYKEALHRSEHTFGGQGGTDGHADAFRHAYWNAMLTQRFGEEWTREFTTAHERNPNSHPTPVAMDLHNNEVGRRIALKNPDASPEELRALVEQAVRDGEMVVVGRDDRLYYSDQVDLGDTRPTSRDNAWPTDNPERKEHQDPGEPGAYPGRGY